MTTHGRPEVVGEARRRLEEAAVAAGIEVGSVEDGGLDVLVVLGGDGTMLRALRATLGTGLRGGGDESELRVVAATIGLGNDRGAGVRR